MPLRDTLRALKRRTEPVDVPDWGRLYVRSLSAKERLEWETVRFPDGENKPDRPQAVALMVRLATVDEAGNVVFTDEDVDWLRDEADSVATSLLYEKAVELNALTKDRAAAIRKNSASAVNGAAASPMSLPEPQDASLT